MSAFAAPTWISLFFFDFGTANVDQVALQPNSDKKDEKEKQKRELESNEWQPAYKITLTQSRTLPWLTLETRQGLFFVESNDVVDDQGGY